MADQDAAAMKIWWLTPDRFDRKPDKSSWLEMAHHLRQAGHEVTILTSGRPAPVHPGGLDGLVVVGALDLPFVFRLTALFNMLRWLRRHASSADIIIVNPDSLWLLVPLWLMGLRRWHLDIRTLPVDTQSPKRALDRILFWSIPLRWFGRAPRSYSFITERLKVEVEPVLGRTVGEYVIWQSGVNSRTFRPMQPVDRPAAARRRLFYHGSLSINRGIDQVIRAMALLNPELNVEFVIVGDGSGAAELRDLARQLGLADRVVFRGMLPYERMPDEINRADLCICPLPERMEWSVSSPLKVFEYMACAKPIIVTPIAAHRDVLEGEAFVVWTDGFEPEAMCRAIERACRDLPRLTSAAGGAPALVAQRYDWSRQAEKLERHLSRASPNMAGAGVS